MVQQVQPVNIFPNHQHRTVPETYQSLASHQHSGDVQFHQPSPMHHQQQPSPMHNQHQQSPMYQQPSNHHHQSHLQPVYSRELSNTINAMTFTPPIQSGSSSSFTPGTTSSFTPDFSSFLPLPPSPSNLSSHNSDPPLRSLPQGPPAPSLHSSYGLGNTISITRNQKLSPPHLPSHSPSLAPTSISPPPQTSPISIPVLKSPTSPRIISPPHGSQYSQVSPRPRGPQVSPGASRYPPQSPVLTPKYAPQSPILTSKYVPQSPVVSKYAPLSPVVSKYAPQSPVKYAPLSPVGVKYAPPSPVGVKYAPPSPVSAKCVTTSPRTCLSSPVASPSRSFLSQPSSVGNSSMSPTKQPIKTPLAPKEHHPLPLEPKQILAPPPPPPQKKIAPVQVPEEIIDPKDIPGVLMKKGNVDIGVFVNHIIQFKHPAFADGDGFAERCLTCIIRKMKNSLPALNNLEKATRHATGDPDPGCVLIPRMKDGRITIAKTGAGVGGNKKIYPHLALVQIFQAPDAQNYSMLASCGGCSNPFAARGVGDFPDTEKVCISPLHYTPVAQDANKARKPLKSPVTTPKKVATLKTIESSSSYAKALVMHNQGGGIVDGKQVEYMDLLNHGEDGKKHSTNVMDEDDEYIDFDDGGIDWEAKWEQEAVDADTDGFQSFNEEDMLKEIEYLTLGKDANGKALIVQAEKKLLEKLKVLDDLKELIHGNVNIGALIPQKERAPSERKKEFVLHDVQSGPSSRLEPEMKFQNM